MSDIFMPEPRMQLVRDVRERREAKTQTSDGPLLDELADALESAQAELRQERELTASLAHIVDRDAELEAALARARETFIRIENAARANFKNKELQVAAIEIILDQHKQNGAGDE